MGGFERKPGGSSLVHDTFGGDARPGGSIAVGKRALTDQVPVIPRAREGSPTKGKELPSSLRARAGRADVIVDIGNASGGLLAFDDTGKRIVVTTYAAGTGTSMWIVGLDGKLQTELEIDRGAPATRGTLGKNLTVSFRGETIWAFTSSFSSGGPTPGSRSGCSYLRVQLSGKEGGIAITDRELDSVFGSPGQCDVRAMCEEPDGGVLLLRHDHRVLTVESRAAPL